MGRLQTLQRFGLASSVEPGVWALSDRLEPALRELGERGDVIKAINRVMTERGIVLPPEAILIASGTGDYPVVGRVIDKRLVDELGDRIGLVIDGADGRVHHVEIGDTESAKDIRVGSIVEARRRPDSRPADRAIAELSRGVGEYRPAVHRALVEAGDVSLPHGADPQAFVDSHVRRLEALRRAGIVERVSASAGPSLRTLSSVPPPSRVNDRIRQACASCPRLTSTNRSPATARPGSTARYCAVTRLGCPRPASAQRLRQRWTLARTNSFVRATRLRDQRAACG